MKLTVLLRFYSLPILLQKHLKNKSEVKELVQIPLISSSAFDSESISRINIPDPNCVLSIDNIETLNTRKTKNRMAPAGVNPATAQSAAPAGVSPVGSNPAAASSNTHTANNLRVITLPAFSNQMQKGQKLVLSQTPVPAIKAALGWNVKSNACDLDVSAFLLSNTGKVPGEDWFVFYGQPDSPDHSVRFREESDPNVCEAIDIDFTKLNPNVEKIVFVLTINEALEKNLNFSMVKDAYIRIMDPSSGKELVSYQMEDYYANVISMMIGELYKHNGIWKFNAVGNGVARDLAGLCELYGVEVASS